MIWHMVGPMPSLCGTMRRAGEWGPSAPISWHTSNALPMSKCFMCTVLPKTKQPNDPLIIQGMPKGTENNDLGLLSRKATTHIHREWRNGDHLVVIPCDVCLFWYINQRIPIWNNAKDNYTLVCIQRANLNAFWCLSMTSVSGLWGFVLHGRLCWNGVL